MNHPLRHRILALCLACALACSACPLAGCADVSNSITKATGRVTVSENGVTGLDAKDLRGLYDSNYVPMGSTIDETVELMGGEGYPWNANNDTRKLFSYYDKDLEGNITFTFEPQDDGEWRIIRITTNLPENK